MIREDGLLKYPRTPHLEGSRLQAGDSASDQLSYHKLQGQTLVVEEKMDGANSGISFSSQGDLRLQSRGHFLVGGNREQHFAMFKRWAQRHEDRLFDILSDRYIMFGEWMFAKHSMFYDALPHLFLEFDVFDTQRNIFLSTPRRHALFAGHPVVSVPVLWSGLAPPRLSDLQNHIGLSVGRTDLWHTNLEAQITRQDLDLERTLRQTDQDDLAEGLYIKIEDADQVLARCKLVRRSFTQTILDGEGHWYKRPIVPNGLRPGADMFSDTIDTSWAPWRPAPSQSSKRTP